MKDNQFRSFFAGVAILVTLIAIGAFWLSFESIHNLAKPHFNPRSAWIFPVLIDGAIVTFSIVRLYAAMVGEQKTAAWSIAFITIGVVLSVLFNVANSVQLNAITAGDTLTIIVHALPPLFLLMSFEMFMAIVHSHVNRSAAIQTNGRLQEETGKLNGVLSELNKAIEQRREQMAELEDAIADLETEQEIAELNETQQAIIEYVNTLPNGAESNQQIADAIGKSRTTAYNHVKKLERLGLLHVNGTIQAVTK